MTEPVIQLLEVIDVHHSESGSCAESRQLLGKVSPIVGIGQVVPVQSPCIVGNMLIKDIPAPGAQQHLILQLYHQLQYDAASFQINVLGNDLKGPVICCKLQLGVLRFFHKGSSGNAVFAAVLLAPDLVAGMSCIADPSVFIQLQDLRVFHIHDTHHIENTAEILHHMQKAGAGGDADSSSRVRQHFLLYGAEMQENTEAFIGILQRPDALQLHLIPAKVPLSVQWEQQLCCRMVGAGFPDHTVQAFLLSGIQRQQGFVLRQLQPMSGCQERGILAENLHRAGAHIVLCQNILAPVCQEGKLLILQMQKLLQPKLTCQILFPEHIL